MRARGAANALRRALHALKQSARSLLAICDEQETSTDGTLKVPVSRCQRRERPDAKLFSFIAFNATCALRGT